jgi:hypothetical protein
MDPREGAFGLKVIKIGEIQHIFKREDATVDNYKLRAGIKAKES